MKIYRDNLTLDLESYPLNQVSELENILFVDIETTGFSAKTASLYEIGCIYFNGEEGRLACPESKRNIHYEFIRDFR